MQTPYKAVRRSLYGVFFRKGEIMAFISMVFASIFIVLLMIIVFLMLIFLVLAIVFKIVGKSKGSRKLKIAGNVFLGLGILFSVPIIALTAYSVFNAAFEEVTLPDGETRYVLTQRISEMNSYIEAPDERSLSALEKLLDKDSSLVFYHDINHYSIIDNGIKMGNADIVRIALEHGAVFDNPERYDRMAYVSSSMDYFLGYDGCERRRITEDDVRILEMMFESNASTEVKNKHGRYSNTFGKAVWAVLYNDRHITDTELEFIQVFVDNGAASDPELLFEEEVKGYNYTDIYDTNVVKDGNYERLMDIIGR